MREKRYSSLHMFLAALSGGLVVLATAMLAVWFLLGPHTLSLVEAWGLVRTQYVGEYDPDLAVDSALEGLASGIGDRWSYYLNAEDYQAQNQRRENSYAGIGVTVEYTDQRGLLIAAVREDSPARKAGLEPGQIITAADGFSLAGENQSQGTGRIQGEAGTVVVLTVLDEAGGRREVEVLREEMENLSVRYELLSGKTGYVRVENFYTHSAQQVKQAVEELVEQGAEGLVFDMRNNGGGYVSELTEMLDYLLPEGPIFRAETKSGRETVTQSDEDGVELPMATLVNADTYSAAEFFAAQLQESVGAPIVGERTSGKGYSQQSIPLPNGGALNLSTGRYRTGAGVSLIGTGVMLDWEMPLEEEKAEALWRGTLLPQEDPQLQKAVELLEEGKKEN
ncbi:MAG: S41 family peptidase [Oscillospiraceae bacterium]|jgi:carboxyl-terminal processing protease|nr:S41 family peptidase [Oscillospiraceae bacterium]